MLLHQLQPKNALKNKKPRVGHGGKRGHTSGRGQKGQTSRSGHRIRPAERDLIIRLPKLRGYKNKPMTLVPQVLRLDDLADIKGTTISKRVLLESGLIRDEKYPVKILNGGDIKRAITLSGIKVSLKVKAKIEAAGGKVLEVK